MVIYGVYIVSKSGGLIFNHDHNVPKIENEKVFTYPLDMTLSYDLKKVSVAFGQKDGINGSYNKKKCFRAICFYNILFLVGHVLTSINGLMANGNILEDGREIKEIIENPESYPLTVRFSRPKMTTNEKIFLASMFYPLFAIASQLSPEVKSSGIEILEADTFKLHCFQTLTGKSYRIHVSKPFQAMFPFSDRH